MRRQSAPARSTDCPDLDAPPAQDALGRPRQVLAQLRQQSVGQVGEHPPHALVAQRG